MLTARTVTILLSALVLASAGCLGGDASDARSGAVSTAGDEGAPAADADAPDATGENASAEAAAEPEPESRPVTFEGRTGTFVCVMTPAGPQCQGSFSSSSTVDLSYEGTPLVFEGTVTWEASSFTGDELQVRVLSRDDEGNTDFQSPVAEAAGTSPLAFTFDLAAHAGMDLFVDVSSVKEAGPAFASMEQAFQFEGVLTFQPEA